MKNFGNSSQGRSQGALKIFRAPTYRAHCAIFAIAQLSHEVPDFTYRHLHGFARFLGDSTVLVTSLTKTTTYGCKLQQSLQWRWMTVAIYTVIHEIGTPLYFRNNFFQMLIDLNKNYTTVFVRKFAFRRCDLQIAIACFINILCTA